MSTLFMLDTNMVSYIARGRSAKARARLLTLDDGETICLSAITEAEISYGLAKRPDATALTALMHGFLASIRVLPWGRHEAQTYGLLRARLEWTGKTLENMDLQIAAHAVATNAVLVTNNKAFAQVDELREAVNWATDL